MTSRSPPIEFVDGRFEITDWIGCGGFSNVWRARDTTNGPDVAIKFPRTDGSNSAETVTTRFKQAYRTLTSYENGIHPTSIVHFLTGQITDPMYIVTEYVPGDELTDVLRNSSNGFGLESCKQYGLKIARAISFLHQNNHMYLDIKPENILIRSDENLPVLIDFNTAESTAEGTTLFYQDNFKAPEQTPGEYEDVQSGTWSDVYALGKLLVYLLSGHTEETEQTPSKGIDIHEYNNSIQSSLRDVIMSATNADPENRPKTATRFVSEILDALGMNEDLALITDERNRVTCPVRLGDTVGRVGEGDDLPAIAVSDPDRYISLVQFEIQQNDSWIVNDRSLNGTYLETQNGWQRLLSEHGHQQIQAEKETIAPDEQPYTAAKLQAKRKLKPVDPGYEVSLIFDPNERDM